jgi:hypothetical protein
LNSKYLQLQLPERIGRAYSLARSGGEWPAARAKLGDSLLQEEQPEADKYIGLNGIVMSGQSVRSGVTGDLKFFSKASGSLLRGASVITLRAGSESTEGPIAYPFFWANSINPGFRRIRTKITTFMSNCS